MPGSPWLEKNKGRDQAPFPSRRLRGWIKPFGIQPFVSLSGNGAAPASSPWDQFFHRKILCAPCSRSGMWLWAFGQIPLLLQRKTGTRRRRNAPGAKAPGFCAYSLRIGISARCYPCFLHEENLLGKAGPGCPRSLGMGAQGWCSVATGSQPPLGFIPGCASAYFLDLPLSQM